MTITTRGAWVPGRWALGFALSAACTACVPFEIVTMESDYITYQHRYTDAAAAEVRKSAERLCGQRNQVPVRTSNACSLTDCTTSYQCMGKVEAERFR